MARFLVFDVETPNRYNNRMSAFGISVVEDSAIVQEYFSCVNPEQPFDWFNTELTGIGEHTVADAPTFPELWKEIEVLFSSGILVVHNAPFDMGVLKKCMYAYRIGWKPTVPYCCTVQMGRRLLPGISHALLLKATMPEVKISVDAACCAGATPEKHLAALETMRSCQIQVMD